MRTTLLHLALLAVGLALTRFRGGLLGTVLLGLVFVPIGVYTFTGTLSNIIYGESLRTFVIPALLAAFSLAGLVAAGAAVVSHGHLEAGGKAGIMVIKASVALFAVMMAAGLPVNMRTLGRTDIAMNVDMHMQAAQLQSDEAYAGGQHDWSR